MDLGISVKTVEADRANIMEKLKVNRATKLLQLTLRYREAKVKGLIQLESLPKVTLKWAPWIPTFLPLHRLIHSMG